MTSNDETDVATPQRIDLTQFDGNNLDRVALTEKAAYDAEYEELTKNMGPGIPANIPDGIVFAPPPPGELARVEWLGHRTEWIQIEDARAIAAVPDLIAELKRCYERLDEANEAMLTAREVLMKHHEWMTMNDATSLEDDQEILDVVKALREASE